MQTIQNGLGSAEKVAAIVGADRLAVGVVGGFGASMRGPGHAHHNGMEMIRFGAHAGLPTQLLRGFGEDLGIGRLQGRAVRRYRRGWCGRS